MPTLYFFRGLPASGKSTKRKEMLADPNLHPIVYTNKDEIRAQLLKDSNGFWSKTIEKQVEKIETDLVVAACLERRNLIVDNTHGSPRHLNRYESIAKRFNYEFKVVNFDTPLEECIRRDALRGKDSVGETVIRQMYRQSFVKPYCPDLTLPKAIIVDLGLYLK